MSSSSELLMSTIRSVGMDCSSELFALESVNAGKLVSCFNQFTIIGTYKSKHRAPFMLVAMNWGDKTLVGRRIILTFTKLD